MENVSSSMQELRVDIHSGAVLPTQLYASKKCGRQDLLTYVLGSF